MSATDDVRFLGEAAPYRSPAVQETIADATAFDRAVILSGHHSLRRDLMIATQLRSAGVDVHAQSKRAAELGLDKLELKRFLDHHGLATPTWGAGGRLVRASEEAPLILKERHGTQSRNIRLATSDATVLPGQYWEAFMAGVEYSVLVYVEPGRTISFPPVWKGQTSLDLLPPWRRLRVCPAPGLTREQASALARLATDVCVLSEAHGYVEVEFVKVADLSLVLEINPRVSGVMRISALATAVPIFSVHADLTVNGLLSPRRVAVELPYDGDPYVMPDRGIYATSRLTVAGHDVAEVTATLADLLGPANVPTMPWPLDG